MTEASIAPAAIGISGLTLVSVFVVRLMPETAGLELEATSQHQADSEPQWHRLSLEDLGERLRANPVLIRGKSSSFPPIWSSPVQSDSECGSGAR